MFITQKTRHKNRLNNGLFLVLFIAIIGSLAWLSTRYTYEADWSADGRNSLSAASLTLLSSLDGSVNITSYALEQGNVRQAVRQLIDKYQRHKSDLSLTFINPDLQPARVRELGIQINGELIIEFQGRRENLRNLSEHGLTNTLQRLARGAERWLVFIEGHAERKAHGHANHDLSQWTQQLSSKGFKVQSHNLLKTPQLPTNTQVLIIASPQVELLAGEVAIINQYVKSGGNLLWLDDPAANNKTNAHMQGLLPLAEQLGIQFQAGTIVDPSTQILGVSDPRFALVADYPSHIINRNIDSLSLFPQSHGVRVTPINNWQSQRLLQTEKRSWSETGALDGELQFDEGDDISGPFTLGWAMSRDTKPQTSSAADPSQQRVVVIGDGDFLSNAYLGNGANLRLGMNIINWLAHDDRLIHIPALISADKTLVLSPLAQAFIGIGFLFVLPLLFASAGFWVWWQRRKR
jgi:gliding motility-associatede transport system auxiliary component